MNLLKSPLYREEILRWSLIGALAFWGLSSTIWAVTKTQTTLLIAIDDNGARLVTDEHDHLIKAEAVNFIKTFIGFYLNFDSVSHRLQIGKAADLMSSELWERSKLKLFEIDKRLKVEPLSQVSEIQSIDVIRENTYEVIALVHINHRASDSKLPLKLTIELSSRNRTQENPWAFEIKELKDEAL